MPKRLTFLSAIAVCAALALPVLAESAPDANTVVARVNGEDITLGHVIVAHAILPDQYKQVPPDVLYNAILDQLIQQSALSQSGPGDTPRHVEIAIENERRSLMAAEEIEKVMARVGTEADIKAAYDEKYATGFGGDEFNASHILVETEEEAKAIVEQLEKGSDFAELAKEKSTGPSGPNGGSLGWFGAGAMVPEFETAVVSLAPGQVSAPVQTQFGWHVVKLNDKRKQAAPDIEAVRDQIAGEIREAAVEQRVEDATRKATIERPVVEGLDFEVIRNLDLVRD